MFDHISMLIEIVLLIWIVWQGQIIVECERGVYRVQKEREDERRQWREYKRKQSRSKTLPAVSPTDSEAIQNKAEVL